MSALPTLRIYNPATAPLICETAAANAASVGAKASAARAPRAAQPAQPAQPAWAAWAAWAIAERLAVIERFRAAPLREIEPLARTRTPEVGKPISQSRNEITGLIPRLDFFLEQTQGRGARPACV